MLQNRLDKEHIVNIYGKDYFIEAALIPIWNDFKAWVEQTQLYSALLIHSGNPNMRIDAFTDDETLSLQLNSKKLRCFEDLPKELLYKFYINSPFYNPQQENIIQKLLTNDSEI